MFSAGRARGGGKPILSSYLCTKTKTQIHKYKSSLGLPPSLASAEENVERLAAFYYRGSLPALPGIQILNSDSIIVDGQRMLYLFSMPIFA